MSLIPRTDGDPRLNQCCERCQALFEMVENVLSAKFSSLYQNDRLKRVPFHNIQSLISSAADGCHICNLIVSELNPEVVEYFLEDLVLNPERAWDQIIATAHPDLQMVADNGIIASLENSRRSTSEKTEPHRYLCDFEVVKLENLKIRPIAATTKSSETLNDIRSWISVCENNHEECVARLAARQCRPPTRLISVGTSRPQLRESHEISLPLPFKYVTLSHCWGPNMNFKLISSRYEEFRNGIDMDQLPKTFSDAVSFTRDLGVDYLWIDSMCIIQDSSSDWEKESLLMDEVYRGAFFNIGANAFYTPSGGLFQDRSPLSVSPVFVELSLQSHKLRPKQFAVFPKSVRAGRIQHAPLSTRAWTTQERLLASRTVHFLNNKVVWECPTLGASESDPTGLLDTSHGAIRGWAAPPPTKFFSHGCLGKWCEAIELYTRGELTFQTDKLIAMAGIASFIKAMWNDVSVRYLAGLWSHQLELLLLWHVLDGKRGTADSRAPSWSWASVRGQIATYPIPRKQSRDLMMANVLEAKTFPINDPLGPVNGGYLRLRGPIFRTTLELINGSLALRLPSKNLPIDFAQLYLDDEKRLRSSFLAGRDSLYLLGVVKDRLGIGQPMSGLVLCSTGANQGEYTRVGYWHVDYWSKSGTGECGSWTKWILEEFNSPSLELKDFETQDTVSGKYIIKII